MSSAQERAKALAAEIKKTVKAIKAAEVKVKHLGEELMQTLTEARAEAEAVRTIIEYPTGRYECKRCGHSTLFTEPTTELPACDNCGHREWRGHEPKITRITPPPPKQYAAGMYECGHCGGRTALALDVDDLPPCELCGMAKLERLDSL